MPVWTTQSTVGKHVYNGLMYVSGKLPTYPLPKPNILPMLMLGLGRGRWAVSQKHIDPTPTVAVSFTNFECANTSLPTSVCRLSLDLKVTSYSSKNWLYISCLSSLPRAYPLLRRFVVSISFTLTTSRLLISSKSIKIVFISFYILSVTLGFYISVNNLIGVQRTRERNLDYEKLICVYNNISNIWSNVYYMYIVYYTNGILSRVFVLDYN